MIELDPIDSLALTLHHAPGVMAVLLGSGVSRAAGIPTGWEITVDLIRRLGLAQGAGEQEDWPAWYKTTFGRAPSYSEILDAVASTPAERRSVIHGYIEAARGGEGPRPTKAHEAIAKLVSLGAIRVVITTNFDRLLEAALRDVGIEPVVIASDDAILGATPLVHSRCTIIKLHGDYMDARIKNTEDELDSYSPSMDALLDRVLDEFGLVVCGWSGDWDTALKAAILRTPSRRYPFYWMSRGEPTRLGNDIISHRQGRIVKADDADTFFAGVQAKVEAIGSGTSHPQSTALVVAQGRKLCRADATAPDWSDLLTVEVAKLMDFLSSPDFPVTSPTPDTMNALVVAILDRTEALRRLVMVGTRWGGSEAFGVVKRVIATLVDPGEAKTSFTLWMDMRLLPASLCLQWAIAAAILRGDMHRLQSVMHMKVAKRHSGRRAAVQSITLAALLGDKWKILKGLERHHTPHSEFFSTVFAADARDIVLSEREAEDAWDDAEFWIALECGALRLPEYKQNQTHFWVPPGKFVWQWERNSLEDRIAAVRSLPNDAEAYDAGLLGGDPETGKEVVDAVEEWLKRVASAWG